MRIALINSPSLSVRPVSRSMAGGLGFDGNEGMLLPPLDLAIMAATLRQTGEMGRSDRRRPAGLGRSRGLRQTGRPPLGRR